MFTVIDDDDLDLAAPALTIEDTLPVVTETVTVRPVARVEQGKTHLGVDSSQWDAAQLLSYVASQIQRLHGPFPRDAKKENAIMRSFASRWGIKAGPIAVFAFEQAGGMWMNAPISLTRFCKGSDRFFGQVILDKHLR